MKEKEKGKEPKRHLKLHLSRPSSRGVCLCLGGMGPEKVPRQSSGKQRIRTGGAQQQRDEIQPGTTQKATESIQEGERKEDEPKRYKKTRKIDLYMLLFPAFFIFITSVPNTKLRNSAKLCLLVRYRFAPQVSHSF